MNNKGRILAFDIYDHKIKLISDAAKRLSINIISAQIGDATVLNQELTGTADKILLDVPCSGIGVIASKPDIKQKRKEEDIEALLDIQKKILENGAKYLKDGGYMVYSTCTILKEENEEQIEKFLENHKDFQLLEEKKFLPHRDFSSGFYIAHLKKQNRG